MILVEMEVFSEYQGDLWESEGKEVNVDRKGQ